MKTIASFLGSKTIWGLVIAAVPTVAKLFGFELAGDFTAQLSALIDQLVTLGGLAFAAYGRAVALRPLVNRINRAED